MRRAARVDNNHPEIVDALRAIGCSVLSLAKVGEGCPDLLCGWRGVNVLLEIKDGNLPPSHRKLNDQQMGFHQFWRGQVATVISIDEAIAAVQACTR